ncbi:DUF3226 domain-containing protein [Anabaenopsis elenkinii]|uniref:Uncharacterized protein n=1 Tax=Anabaenopsis elenkinii CCIBt3563 TaxID=2779889 RepID=A0A7S6U2Q5_9CYAN|nr:DUF3226 domain-containing protein [Anabaenopsis elenkinii]QOV23380.1 hypothetical protein IM676_03410 [Anabaenopsis elenkinii CCIBt3563]
MSRKYALIGVEGPHDLAFLSKVLKLLKFQAFDGKESNLDPFWAKFKPTYPKKGGNLYERLDMPAIYYTDNLSVAIYAGGGSNLGSRLLAILANHTPYKQEIVAFGIIADADQDSPNKIAQEYSGKFQVYFPQFPTVGGKVDTDYPRTGIYVLPDNIEQGVLENILHSCGHSAYPFHMEKAESYLAEFDAEHKLDWKPFDHHKALIATVVSVLKPGKTNTVSIKDNNWISEDTCSQVPALENFVEFIKQLLDI